MTKAGELKQAINKIEVSIKDMTDEQIKGLYSTLLIEIRARKK
jgi:hypothetical protein